MSTEDTDICNMTKIESAKQCVQTVLDQLNTGDRFAIVLFNSNASVMQRMNLVSQTNMGTVRRNVGNITAGGSTNMAAGMEMAERELNNFYEMNSYEYENRIIFLTDAMPNTGDVSGSGLINMVERNADSRIYTTFIGIGVDFNTELIDMITKTKGANYYSVHSPRQFRERMADEFDFMVTPLVFDLQLNLQSSGWKIAKVFGSPEADEATGRLMTISTLFPSKKEGGQTKGGLVLLKLTKTSALFGDSLNLRVTYEDRDGRRDTSESSIVLEKEQPEYFENSGIRKGVLLARYGALMQNWLIDENSNIAFSRPWQPSIHEDEGITIPNPYVSRWERQSLPLTVSAPYRDLFKKFVQYFSDEMYRVNDDSLQQEVDILNNLVR